MPTYEYTCAECIDVFEKFVPMEQRDGQACPTCGDTRFVERMLAAPAVMNVAMADGTRRFDKVREYQKLERAKKHADKESQAKMTAEQNKVLKGAS